MNKTISVLILAVFLLPFFRPLAHADITGMKEVCDLSHKARHCKHGNSCPMNKKSAGSTHEHHAGVQERGKGHDCRSYYKCAATKQSTDAVISAFDAVFIISMPAAIGFFTHQSPLVASCETAYQDPHIPDPYKPPRS
ncbi:MAG: hypothetical protein HY886_09575 [Deltaproteobacteria bacterium]|nr:hypothetical protein [Deltaproteobacteria bacterium]